MKFKALGSISVMTLFIALAISGQLPAWAQSNNQEGKIIEFNAPGAATDSTSGCAPYCGTFPYQNNDFGVIVGYYTDVNVVPHGFLRTPAGEIISFDAPGAGLGHGLNQGTAAYSINDFGAVTGQFEDSNDLYHAYVRYPDGSFSPFEAPGAATESSPTCAPCGTLAWNINLEGATSGDYFDGNGGEHGFIRSRQGEITQFDAPGAVYTFVCQETCLNLWGAIAGGYGDTNGAQHGFVREPNGSFTTFDPPGTAGFTSVASINLGGTITGFFFDSNGLGYGFIRYADGSFVTFQDPEAALGNNQGTYPFSINSAGAVTGQYTDAANINHGFERSADGKFTTFNAPNANTPGIIAGTRPTTNNLEGAVVGWGVDPNNLNHGFVWYPEQPIK